MVKELKTVCLVCDDTIDIKIERDSEDDCCEMYDITINCKTCNKSYVPDQLYRDELSELEKLPERERYVFIFMKMKARNSVHIILDAINKLKERLK